METAGGFQDFTIGGYPEELFLNLTAEEKAAGECSICYLISREPRECALGHIFCTSCIVSWATGTSGASGKCPVCRAPGRYYRPATTTRTWLHSKWVRCLDGRGCTWTGVLRELKHHRRAAHHRNSGNAHSEEKLIPLVVFQRNRYALLNNRHRAETGGLFNSTLDTERSVTRLENNAESEEVANTSHSTEELTSQVAGSSQNRDSQREVHPNRPRPEAYLPVSNPTSPCGNRDQECISSSSIRHEMLSDVDAIRHQLSQVSSSLSVLLQRMGKDQERYTSYIRDIPSTTLSPSLHDAAMSPSSQRTLRRAIVPRGHAVIIERERKTPNSQSYKY